MTERTWRESERRGPSGCITAALTATRPELPTLLRAGPQDFLPLHQAKHYKTSEPHKTCHSQFYQPPPPADYRCFSFTEPRPSTGTILPGAATAVLASLPYSLPCQELCILCPQHPGPSGHSIQCSGAVCSKMLFSNIKDLSLNSFI